MAKPTLDVKIEAKDVDRIIDAQKKNLEPVLKALLEIVDACYQSDPDVAKWKPIREKIEGLLNV